MQMKRVHNNAGGTVHNNARETCIVRQVQEMYAPFNIKMCISCQGEKCTFYASKVKTCSMQCTYSMLKDQWRTSNVTCTFYATKRIRIVQDAFMQYVWWHNTCYKQCRAWCLGNAINKQSSALESTSWGEWRWTALLWRGSPLVFFEHLPSTHSSKVLKCWQEATSACRSYGCRFSSWSYSQLSLFSNWMTY